MVSAGDIWIAQLASVPFSQGTGRLHAVLASARAQIPQAQVLDSSRYASLNPGYWVIYYAGPFANGAQALTYCAQAGRTTRAQCIGRFLSHDAADFRYQCYPPAASPQAGCYRPAGTSPAVVVRAYIAAINRRDWPQVWQLGGKNLGTSYSQMIAGYQKTSKIVVTTLTASGQNVSGPGPRLRDHRRRPDLRAQLHRQQRSYHRRSVNAARNPLTSRTTAIGWRAPDIRKARLMAGESDNPKPARETVAREVPESLAGAGPSARKPRWVLDLEARHDLPIEQIPGTVYALHYDPPQVVRSVSGDYAGPDPRSDSSGWLSAGPVRHYVGWTQQRDPRKRIGRHAPMGVTEIVYLEPGTMLDERELKRTGQCARCREPFRSSLAAP